MIDVGILKVKIELREYQTHQQVTILYKKSIRTALGRDWKNNHINQQSVTATVNAILSAKKEMAEFGNYTLQAIGTEALRKANNGDEVLSKINLETGVRLSLLKQAEEAELFFTAVTKNLNTTDIVSLDVGGGSVQVVVGDKLNNLQTFPFPTGTYGVRTKYIDSNHPTKAGFYPRKNIYSKPYHLCRR